MMLEKLTAENFSPLLEQEFQIELEHNKTLLVRLIEVSINNQSEQREGRQSFSIIFRGPRDFPFEQGTYQVSNETLGEVHIFLVPIGPDEKGLCMEAVFN
jgi:hypothetical protein